MKLKNWVLKIACISVSGENNGKVISLCDRRTETNVAGKKASVSTATVFIAALSLRAALLIRTVAWLSL